MSALTRSAALCCIVATLFLCGTVAAAPRDKKARGPATQPTTQPGQWVDVGKGVRARMFFGVWLDKDSEDNRPGHAARMVRLIPDTDEEHFGITLTLELPREFTGDLYFREKLTLPAKPRQWDQLNQAMREMLIDRTISPDGRSSTITETMRYAASMRILTFDNQPVGNYPTPFTTWDFDPAGDPPGEWSMECWLNNTYLGKHTFQVVRGKKGDMNPVMVPDEELEKARPRQVDPISSHAKESGD
jgi:hypothetical protein